MQQANQSAAHIPGKRPRGRPRVAHPLTPAERARRYRQRKAEQAAQQSAAPLKRDASRVTKNRAADDGALRKPQSTAAVTPSQQESETLQRKLSQAIARQADLTGALHEVVQLASSGRRIPAHVLKGLVTLLARS
ncbi:MAG TPA: hypothetical protein VIG66_05520 [Noviherbaspirillum sp.]